MRECIVTLAQLLRLINKYDDIRLYAFGSYPCENFFSFLRMLSNGNNSAEKAEQLIENHEVLQYCLDQLE